MSKAELARKAGVSPVTVDRLENGAECRMSTKRKIILALGLKLTDRNTVFPGDVLTKIYPEVLQLLPSCLGSV